MMGGKESVFCYFLYKYKRDLGRLKGGRYGREMNQLHYTGQVILQIGWTVY